MIDVTVVIPVYREVAAVADVVRAVRARLDATDYRYEIIVVDDGSDDGSADAAEAAGARVLRRPVNLGNGAAVKRGLRAARGRYTLLMDGDGQHDPAGIPELLARLPAFDMAVGARSSRTPQALHRRVANALYNRLASYVADFPILDLTSGFRVMKTSIARRFLYLLPNRFSYPTTLTLSFIRAGHSVHFQPLDMGVRVGRSKIRPLRDGLRFLLVIARIGVLFGPFRVFLPVSLFFLLSGLGYGVWMLGMRGHFSNGMLVLLVTGVLIFLLSLMAHQLSYLHFIRSEEPLDGEEQEDRSPR